LLASLANLGRLRAGHPPCIVLFSCLAGLFVRLTGLFVSLAGFWVFGNKICQTVRYEIFFFPPHIILGVGKQRDLGNKIYQTVGDTLTCLLLFYIRIQKITKRRNSCLVSAPRHLISLYKLAQLLQELLSKKNLLQEQRAIGLESSLPIGPSQGLARVCLPRSGPQCIEKTVHSELNIT
jgi:uncharacterized membrane protein YfbV (UPF0208 family)